MKLVFPRLETERLVLRQVVPSDAEDLFVYLSDFEVMKYYGTEPFENIERVDQAIEKYDTMFREQRGLRLGIEWKESGKLIGNCGFYNWMPDQFNAEMVVVLRKEYWQQGIMTEALHRMISYGFEEMGLHRIQGMVEPGNIASRRLFEKVGFTQEGVLRDYTFVFGEFRDLMVYGMLKYEYEQK
ncbi:hypothetical protein CBW65_06135 [Tumebacillus avium]|uniref:N-acetyltransferase domain-containing protein n=1 Tax=Tumebacillus avium TaxID=1903704 RepID=A0A1Y0IJL9_9BACL|nr:GNAT family protein [Tumebacillus avium]ARU60711.1 hypothetical protein CBW65_06135 [Tumebacillus avium]